METFIKKETAVRKINKIGKVGRIAAKVLQVLTIIGAVIMLLTAIGVMILPKNFLTFTRWANTSSIMNVDVFMEKFGVDDEGFAEGFLLGMEESLDNVTVNGKSVEKVETVAGDGEITMNSKEEGYTIDLHDIATVIILAFVACVFALVTILFVKKLAKAYENCESPFEENVIRALRNFAISLIPWVVFQTVGNAIINKIIGNSVNITLNLGLVFVILAFFGLVYVFKYGAMLQKESDETL